MAVITVFLYFNYFRRTYKVELHAPSLSLCHSLTLYPQSAHTLYTLTVHCSQTACWHFNFCDFAFCALELNTAVPPLLIGDDLQDRCLLALRHAQLVACRASEWNPASQYLCLCCPGTGLVPLQCRGADWANVRGRAVAGTGTGTWGFARGYIYTRMRAGRDWPFMPWGSCLGGESLWACRIGSRALLTPAWVISPGRWWSSTPWPRGLQQGGPLSASQGACGLSGDKRLINPSILWGCWVSVSSKDSSGCAGAETAQVWPLPSCFNIITHSITYTGLIQIHAHAYKFIHRNNLLFTYVHEHTYIVNIAL